MFQDRDKKQKLPRFLRESIEEMLYEREHSGIETTPDETSNTIEELFQYLGKIWICLFLDAASNPKNKGVLPVSSFLYVYENITSIISRNGATIGNWIRISRYIQNIFKENNIANPLSSLQNFDFGFFDKGDQRTNMLLSFRNEFAHGAFQANAQYIDEHFDILSGVFEELTDLYQTPIVYLRNKEVWDTNHHRIEIEFPIELDEIDSKYAYLLCRKEQSLISLSPFFLFTENILEENICNKIQIQDLFYAKLFAIFVSRYTSEMNGNFDSNAAFKNRDEFEVDQNVLQEVLNICETSSDKNIFLVEAYPGSHYQALGQELYVNQPSGFDTCIFWDVKEQDITQSATALINKILVVSKSELNSNVKIRKRAKEKEKLQNILEVLQTQGKRIFLYINDLHLGMNVYRQEEYRIADILQYLIDTPITLVATLHHGYLQKGIFYDAVFQYQKILVDDDELRKAVSYYVNTERRKQIFSVLQPSEGLHLFDICDQIEQRSLQHSDSHPAIIFEPQVEYDLWRCSALLSMERVQKKKEEGNGLETLRLWSLAHPNIKKFL